MNEHFFLNDRLMPARSPVFDAQHPGIMHGDGIFETMRMHDGKLINEAAHRERLASGCAVLNYRLTTEKMAEAFGACHKLYLHKPEPFIRIRLSVYRAASSFTSPHNTDIDYLVQRLPLTIPSFQQEGIAAAIYTDGFKGTGKLASLKSTSYQLYTAAYQAARRANKAEAIILNAYQRVCETSIGNIFFAEGGQLFTPSLGEGCVAGTIRRWLLSNSQHTGIHIQETLCTAERLLNAEEVFMTNAIKWVVPITQIDQSNYESRFAGELFQRLKEHLL